ncbi:MAG TPA: hypothetical protein VEC37_08310 [Bacillota bacterium]|nr:hypothetical protein [Bacillota bacterium]
MVFWKYRKLCLLLLTFGILFSPAVTTAKGVTPKKVLILDLPRFTFEDVQPQYRNITQLCQTGAVGVLAPRISGVVNPEKLYLNLNSGKQLWSVEDSRNILTSDEIYNGMPAGQLYQALTGFRPQPGGAVYLGLPKTIQLNYKQDPRPNIGAIGNILNQHKLKAAVIGNADSVELINRAGAIVLVDEQGLIDLAALGPDTVTPDPGFPSGLRSNNEQIFKYWQQFSGQAQVISITLGDLERIERFHDYVSESRKAYFRKKALQEYDRLIGRLLDEINPAETMVVLYSIMAPEIEGQGQRLNPVVIKHPGLKTGLIVSNSTRRPALLTGPDLFATVFTFLGVENHGFLAGRYLRTIPGNWRQAGALLKELDLNYQVRWTLLPIHGYALIGLVVLILLGLVFWPTNLKLFEILQRIYLFLLTIPAVFLVEALISPVKWPEIAVWTLTIAGGFYLVITLIARKNHRLALITIALVTIGLIIGDGLYNGFLELRSFWGYSAVAAARFYGVGNEYLGFLLGAYLVAVTLGLAPFKHQAKLLWLMWLVITVFLFCPVFGANMGGGISALIGLGLANFFWLEHRVSKKEIAILLGSLLIMLVLVGIGDFLIFGKQMSHFGQFIRSINEDGISTIIEMVSRKWQLNMTLIGYTSWSYILIGLLVVIPILYKNPPKPVEELITKYPDLAKGVLGFVITCIIAFLVNDSGIVTVATMFIFGFDMLLVTIIEECRSKEMTRIE